MNKILKVLALISFLLLVGVTGWFESTYTREAICSNYTNSGVYTFTDKTGHVWEWEEQNPDVFSIGDSYTLIMDNYHSSSIYDDQIKKIK